MIRARAWPPSSPRGRFVLLLSLVLFDQRLEKPFIGLDLLKFLGIRAPLLENSLILFELLEHLFQRVPTQLLEQLPFTRFPVEIRATSVGQSNQLLSLMLVRAVQHDLAVACTVLVLRVFSFTREVKEQ